MIEFKPRYFVLPAIALTVLAMLHAPADGGRAVRTPAPCRSRDPGIRASFAAFAAARSRPRPRRSAPSQPTICR